MTVTDNKTGRVYKCEMGIDTGLLELLNSLAEKNEWLTRIIRSKERLHY